MLKSVKTGRKRRTIVIVAVIAAVLFLVGPVVKRVVQHPRACTVCHFMEPYYDQWRTSKHANVTCVKCHPYGAAFLTVALLKYSTNTYNPRPHAFVKDSACLEEGCHNNRLEDSKTRFLGSIIFDHSKHIGRTARGIKLHCTSCHSQIVQGEHISVTKDVCVLCHFMGAGEGQAITGCPSCHGVPTRVVEHDGFRFSHESYLKIGVACDQCHLKVTEGTGDVPAKACNTCHVTRVEHKSEPALVHKIHVEGRGLDCMECHQSMKHGEFRMINALEITCEKCHSRLHQFQKEMYMGAGARGVSDLPSRMFAAQVSCDGCHIKKIPAHEAGAVVAEEESLEPSRQACVTCHGKGYDLMLDDWMRVNTEMLDAVGPVLQKADASLKKAVTESGDYPEAQILMMDADYNYRFVKFGRGAHNIEYSYRSLATAWDQADLAMKTINPSFTPAGRPTILADPSSYCMILCHGRIGLKEKVYFADLKLDFPHETHVKTIGIPCTTCHSPEKHKMRIISAEGCMSCHHEAQDLSCETCHPRQKAFFSGKWTDSPVAMEPDVMSEAELECTSCHDLSVKGTTLVNVEQMCVSCHDEEAKKWLADEYNDIQKKVSDLTALLVTARQKIASVPWPRDRIDKAQKVIDSVQKDLDWLDKARGIHNYKMAVKILEFDKKRLEEAIVVKQ